MTDKISYHRTYSDILIRNEPSTVRRDHGPGAHGDPRQKPRLIQYLPCDQNPVGVSHIVAAERAADQAFRLPGAMAFNLVK